MSAGDGIARIADQRLAVTHRVDVDAAERLDAEQQESWDRQLLGHVHYGGINTTRWVSRRAWNDRRGVWVDDR